MLYFSVEFFMSTIALLFLRGFEPDAALFTSLGILALSLFNLVINQLLNCADTITAKSPAPHWYENITFALLWDMISHLLSISNQLKEDQYVPIFGSE